MLNEKTTTIVEGERMPKSNFYGLLLAPVLALAIPGAAQAVVEEFEAFNDGDALTSQIAGLAFSNATVLSAGLSLNDGEFPPRSGANAVFDDGGEIAIDFDDPLASIGAYFTYVEGLTFTAYGAASNVLGIDTSAFFNNSALARDAGSMPNEFLGVFGAPGIRRIVITGGPLGGTFVKGDLTDELAQTGEAPEPGTLPLVLDSLLRASWLRGVAHAAEAHAEKMFDEWAPLLLRFYCG
jgi:hypothetical protein